MILVGELRDLETISVALTAAETGHLVLATLHTQSAQDTISRVVDVFPADQQQQVRTQLAATLQGVVCQTLVKTADGAGRAAAVEVMVCNTGIRAMIRDDKLQQIQGALQAGAKDGMQTLNANLAALVRAGRISYDAGLEACTNRADFETLAGSPAPARDQLAVIRHRLHVPEETAVSSTATQYAYKVRDQQGKLTEGKVEAVSEAAVAEKLLAMGYVPLEVKPANVGMQREINIGPKKRVKTKDLAVFSRQFATMIDAGLTMIRALSIMADQSENPELRRILRGVKGDVEAGLSLSAAFAKFPATLPAADDQHDQGRRGGRLPGRRDAPDRRQLRGRGEAARQDQGRADLPGRGVHAWRS